MSIMPPGGWVNSGSKSLICKTCDTGTYQSKKVFRLSGPAVAIGFILLMPSIIGMLLSGLLFLGILTIPIPGRTAIHTVHQTGFDADFRRSCVASFLRRRGDESLDLAEQACECALTTVKETGSSYIAVQNCAQQAIQGSLDPVPESVKALYSDNAQNDDPPSTAITFFRLIGGVSAISLLIASFVGGLLGWLLVMKKNILQCDTCSAVVNAS